MGLLGNINRPQINYLEEKYMYENEIIIDGRGSTSNGERILKKLRLDQVTKVTITKQGGIDGGPANVDFHFADGDVISIINSFGIGYGGTGPWGIHDILVKMGVSLEEADKIFTHCSYTPRVIEVPTPTIE